MSDWIKTVRKCLKTSVMALDVVYLVVIISFAALFLMFYEMFVLIFTAN